MDRAAQLESDKQNGAGRALPPLLSAIGANGMPPFFSIPELADRWRCSRASVYNRIRGEKVVDFAARGKKGHKLVPLEVVLKIESAHARILR